MKKSRIVRVGLIKAVPERWDLEANWKTFVRLAVSARKRKAQIICTPECFLDGYAAAEEKGWSKSRFRKIGQPLSGNGYLRKVMDFAREQAVHLVFGFTELTGEGCYNSAALINDQGELAGVYRKTHLLDHDKRFLPGKDLPVWKTSLGKIGVMICADRRWPEVARTLKAGGAEIIINPSYGMWHLENEWWMRTRSYENELFICFVHPRTAFIAGPKGELAAKLQNDRPGVLVSDIDLSRVSCLMFKNRRTDLYRM